MRHPFRAAFDLFSPPGIDGSFSVSGAAGEMSRTLGPEDDGQTFNVSVVDGSRWETRSGCTYSHADRRLTRGTFVSSSTGSAINLSSGAVVVAEPLSDTQLAGLVQARFGSRGISGAQRILGAAPFPPTTPGVAICMNWPAPASFTGLQLVHINQSPSVASTITAKVAPQPTVDGGGANLSYQAAAWAGASSVVLPVAVGATPNDVPSYRISDLISLTPANAENLVHVRTYFAGANNGIAQFLDSGQMSAMRTETGLKFSVGNAAATVADSADITQNSGGQLVCPAGIIWQLEAPSVTVAAVGGSTIRGTGSAGGNNNFVTQACRSLTTADLIWSPFVAAINGANSLAAMGNALAVLDALRPQFLVFLGGSGNDGSYSASAFATMRSRIGVILDGCRKYYAHPIAGTISAGGLSGDDEARRQTHNTFIRSLSAAGVSVLDCALITDDPANPSLLKAAANSGDGTHWTNLYHGLVGAELQILLRAAVMRT